jgi:hypothetical protein
MNEDFVTYELAVKLKEKGFDEPCYGYYHCNGGNDSFEVCGNGDYDFLNSKNKHRIAAPTIPHILKWYEWVINPNTRECERVLRYAECTAVIDTNQLDGDVMEIPYEEYKEWWDNNYHCLGVTGL